MCVAAAGSLLLLGAPATALNPSHQCLSCHSLHGGRGDALLKEDVVEVLCLTCHGPGGISTLKADVHTNSAGSSYPAFEHTCTDCHTPHSDPPNWLAGTNLKMVGTNPDDVWPWTARILTPNSGIREVVFESRGSGVGQPTLHSFADNDEDGDGIFDGICESCHTQTSHHRNNAPDAAHYTGATCSSCHTHDTGFVATSGSCSDCHSAAQGSRRAVIGEFARASHHLQTDPLDDSDCVVCHEMTQHQQGSVRLLNADDPGNPFAVIALAGDPGTVPAEAAKLEVFCLACHDADAAGGAAPFSDGLMPPEIDAALWAGASHPAATLTCYGDGQSSGCHATGHGSEKQRMLAPANVAPVPPAYAEEEEGFCFTCHDADGPAATDVRSQFEPPIRWVTGPAGDLGNMNLNDRHDVQFAAQSISGARVECTDCHDPHSASPGAPLRPDPDPSDGRVPGTGAILAGADFQTEWCLDCHDGSMPVTVTPPATALADVRSTFQADDAHGLRGGRPTLKSGYGWAEDDVLSCTTCHTNRHVAARTNLFGLVDTVWSRDGMLPIPDDDGGFTYEMTDNAFVAPFINGYMWCNTCHTGSMGAAKSNCFSCHYHGRRF
ncbi:MAG: cytochrome c3 family protein [Planctomycetota bacterium]|jgi:predicted CXXCH cytochrome family protein